MEAQGLGYIILWLSSTVGPIGFFLMMALAMRGQFMKKHLLGQTAIVLMGLGLLGQAVRSYIALTTGHAPTDAELPLWYMKDLGIVLWISYELLKSLGKVKDKCEYGKKKV